MKFFESAAIGETILNAATVMVITFAALIMLFLLIKIFSVILGSFRKRSSRATCNEDEHEDTNGSKGQFSAGELVLKDVDERTAAMIMAIVSDKSGIPLERLIFRSIKLIK